MAAMLANARTWTQRCREWSAPQLGALRCGGTSATTGRGTTARWASCGCAGTALRVIRSPRIIPAAECLGKIVPLDVLPKCFSNDVGDSPAFVAGFRLKDI